MTKIIWIVSISIDRARRTLFVVLVGVGGIDIENLNVKNLKVTCDLGYIIWLNDFCCKYVSICVKKFKKYILYLI